MLTPKQYADYLARARKSHRDIRLMERRLKQKHVSEDGKVYLSVYLDRLPSDVELVAVSDATLKKFRDEVESALRIYDARRPASIRIYSPMGIDDAYREVFLRGVRKSCKEEYIYRRMRYKEDVLTLLFFLLMGMLLLIVNSHFKLKEMPILLTGTLDVIDCVMIWTFVDYIIEQFIPGLRGIRRIMQVCTAKFTFNKWE